MFMTMKKRVLVAMSGGVDSSVAALLLKKQGFDVIGITFQLYDFSRLNKKEGKGGCCSIEDVDDARIVADKLGIRHYLTNSRERFRKKVIDYFADSYRKGETPNPCVACNTFIKFDELEHYANLLEADFFATGHYAQILHNTSGQYEIHRALDEEKDQSYFLMGVNPKFLSRCLFPCGAFTKDQIRDLAIEAGLCVGKKKDSMEICFIANTNYKDFLKKEYQFEDQPGEIVDEKGNLLGQHQGVHHFTVGQRRGLGALGLSAYYVIAIKPESRQVIVGEAHKVFAAGMMIEASQFREASQYQGKQLTVKIRSRSPFIPVRIEGLEGNHIQARFEEPQRAVTPGQFAVFYDEKRVLGGGAILRSVPERAA